MSLTDEQKQSYQKDGIISFKNAVPHGLIDQYNAEVSEFRKTCGETKDEHGFGQRIGCLHVEVEPARKILFNPVVVEAIQELFNEEPLLLGSLTFEAGTQQHAHDDSIFFYTTPANSMIGAWTALEDINPDAGPIFYYPGSHLWGLDGREEILKKFPELADGKARNEKTPGNFGMAWTQLLDEKIEERNAQKIVAEMEKGDTVIWHGNVIHGGIEKRNPKLTRKSIVGHFMRKSAQLYDRYFELNKNEFTEENAFKYQTLKKTVAYIAHPGPVTC
ncbi:hypothetical protein MNBD_NITROSPINAE01-1440 [hydrothermal vent metagenome]|uniref:Phytanoyl-CoA dioxygenase n=1 Tax=hydrothermal vent metagenome TaxID=652676 RepID=A0A3B1BC16_9ZZZZ